MHPRRTPLSPNDVAHDGGPDADHASRLVRSLAIASVFGLAAIGLACSSDSGSSPSDTPTSAPDTTLPRQPRTDLAVTTTTIGPAKVGVRSTPLGDIVVDGDGMTLYVQVVGAVDGCTATCLDAWPPFRATSVTAGSGIAPGVVELAREGTTPTTEATVPSDTVPDPASTTTTTASAEGIVTIDGRPLHRFIGDARPGDTTGQDFNRTFFVVQPDGTPIQPPPPTTTTTSP